VAVATWNGADARYNWSPALRQIYRAYWRAIWEAQLINDKGVAAREDAKDCVTRPVESSWWEWLDGSRPFHWWWPEEYQHTMMDCLRLWYKGTPPTYIQAQRLEPHGAASIDGEKTAKGHGVAIL
jgi:hypothetical protein